MISFLAQTTTELDILDYASKIGVITLLAAVIYGGFREWWVWGHHYRRHVESLNTRVAILEKEKNAWRDMALRASGIAEAAVQEAFKNGS